MPSDIVRTREEEILDYIIANDGCSQNEVVTNFEGDMAENTVKSYIKKLAKLHEDERPKVIIDTPPKYRNGQPYRLRANFDHPLVVLHSSLKDFRDRYFRLLDRALSIYVKEYSKASKSRREELWKMLHNVKQVFESTMAAYLMVARFDWGNGLERPLLKQLFYEVFSKAGPMQDEVTEKVSKAAKKEHAVTLVYNDGDIHRPRLELRRIADDMTCQHLYREYELDVELSSISEMIDENLYSRLFGSLKKK